MKQKIITLLVSTLVAIPGLLQAEERIQLQSTSIVGNKELPKMLYIVPWKSSELPEMNVPPIEGLVDEALAPVDRDSFRRKIHYYQVYTNQGDSR